MALSRSRVLGVAALTVVATGCSLVVDFAGFIGTDAGAADGSPLAADGAVNSASDGSPQSDGNDTVIVTDATPRVVEDAPSSGPCTIAAVQAVPGTAIEHVMTATNSDNKTITETAGNLLVAVAYGGQGPGNTTPITTAPNMTFTVTDTLGNTFYAGPMIENGSSHQAAVQIFYAMNIAGGANTVTVTSAASAVTNGNLSTGLFLQEYSGLATTDVVDVASAQMAPGMSATVVPGNVSTQTSCDLVVGAFADGHVSEEPLTAGAGWSLRSTDVWDPGGAVDNVQTGGVPQNTAVNATINLTSGADNGWVASQLAFRAATTSPLAQPDHVAFTTTAHGLGGGACSTAVTVRSFASTALASSSTGITMTLSGAAMTFYADEKCAFPITTLSIGAGMNAATFFYGGTPGVITVTPKGLSPITQNESGTNG